ncbi:indolepyruvate ferredoxin oxidoreductase family protein [Novosphingobium sp. PASSN1]|uniref:indolepyruvate ferredoxin oxidoreductase family protein n=1 Tax=Novosphingobium sp. PASSN1 TaxID=2015561 RepID=UPI000BDBD751|nr:indolepyruvate ferredoxin oxidoreductase family protein [Novosphingobium sp. PASSN1]OYU34452.1 MAG: indolepyruvate ferredoxin oxidoreductase [Novosphingobium sp. PASSN1]
MDSQAQAPRVVSLNDKWNITRGRILLNGTQALARVLLAQRQLDCAEGIHSAGYISGYRGSPLGNVDTTLWSIGDRLRSADIKFQPGVNEDLAATAIAGTQQIDQIPGAKHDGVFAAWYGKGPGVDRSGDAFKHGNYAGAHPKGGVVVFYGDDHAGKSSTVAYQSEQAIAASAIPSFYPANVGEILHYGLMALALSRHSGSWVAVKCVNEVVEQTATVDIDLDNFKPVLPAITAMPTGGLHATVRPFNPLQTEQIVNDFRLPLIAPFVRANRIDRAIFRATAPQLAIVSAGKSYGDVLQALSLLRLDAVSASAIGISLYKVGCIWPLDGESLAEFARGHATLLVVEEKKSFLEAQAASALINDRAAPRLIGKVDEEGRTLLSSTLQLEPADIAVAIANRLEHLGLLCVELGILRDGLSQRKQLTAVANNAIKRSPFFCSGCPHNRSTRIPDGSLSMTGIGCHTMANFVRPEEALLPAQMGGEGGNWLGLAPFTTTPHMFQNMGDGTYYHSGLLAIRAAVSARVNITYKILYNDAVAMTGGQPVDGPISVSEMAQQVRHEGVSRIVILSDNPDHHRSDPSFPPGVTIGHRDELDRIQRELREIPGCSVLIYEQTCAAEKRRRRKQGRFPDPAMRMFIADKVCEGCGDCSVQSTCVSIMPKPTAFGTKRMIDQSSCNKDYSCNEGFCPSFITVRGAEPRKPEAVAIDESIFAELPAAPIRPGPCNLMVAGIGGTGVITVGALIGMAAHIDGYAASLFDMTGLAQKNGAVFSHIRIADKPAELHTQRLGHGEADVLLAFDLVAALAPEAANSCAEGRTRAIANINVAPTAAFQFDRDATIEPNLLLEQLARQIGLDAVTSVEATTLAKELLGDTIAANLMLVGIAHQRGMLPVSTHAIEAAIRLNRVAVTLNLAAFRLGRLFVDDPGRVSAMQKVPIASSPELDSIEAVVAHWSAHLCSYQDEALAQRYREFIDRVAEAEAAVRPGSSTLTKVVARNYARLLAVKDEYEVARLLTDPALHAQIRNEFSEGAVLSFNLAPPFLGGRTPNGRPRKREFPAQLMMPVLRLLAKMKWLRGTPFDLFGWHAERRAERRLLAHYEALVAQVTAELTAETIEHATATLGRIDAVRGFGPVKENAMQTYMAKVTETV